MLDSEIKSMRMIPVKYQAALMYGISEADRKPKYDQSRLYFEKYVKGIKNLMKGKDSNSKDFEYIDQYFSCWRDYITNNPKLEDIEMDNINKPKYFDKQQDENDIYMYSGYVKPGIHDAVVYSPADDLFYKMTNIAVFPSKQELKVQK